MRVLVAGRGVAGVSSAISASRSGAKVTVVESAETPAVNASLLPLVLSGKVDVSRIAAAEMKELASHDVEVCLGERVLDIDASRRTVKTGSRRFEFDSLILCTGTRPGIEAPRGVAKKNAFLMKTHEDYLRFHSTDRGWSRVAVIGPAPLSLVVAASLAKRAKVTIFLGRNGLGRFPVCVREMVREVAGRNGLILKEANVDAILGGERVEAILSGGEVYTNDCAIVLPKRVPDFPRSDLTLGLHGGILVDSYMRASMGRIFAAGDCCEARVGAISLPTRLRSSSRLMGEVAGLNSAGAAVRASLSFSIPLEILGLEVLLTGLSLDDALTAGLPARMVELGPTEGSPFVSIVYETSTHRTLGIQAAGLGALSLSGLASIAVSSSLTLEDLAYHESPYIPSVGADASPIALTAGKALARVQERTVETKGTRVRHS